MIKFTQGDIFSNNADIRVNTVNCIGAMGKGVALAFKKKYPEMFKQYKEDCKKGLVKTGKMYIWKDLTSWIINFPTKDDWKDPSKCEYIESGLIDLAEYLRGYGSVTVALPALGCGNGGLDWDIVSKMIQKYLGELEANILVYTPRDSYSAGKTVQDVSLAQGESLMLELGFYKEHLKNISNDLWASGNMNILHRAWVLFSSPDEITEKQLTSIISASLLLHREQITPIFIYNNEKIISYLHKLNNEHIPVVVIFPFFIPKKSNLVSKLRELKNNLYISIIKTEIQYGVAYVKTINFALSKAIGYILWVYYRWVAQK